DSAGKTVELVGISIGAGKIEIIDLNGFQLRLSGNHPAILVMHSDRFGATASISNILAKHEINTAHMDVNRKDLGEEAMTLSENNQNIQDNVMQEMENADHINHVSTIVS